MFKRRKRGSEADPSIYNDLRSQVLMLEPATAGLRPTEELPDAWGVLLETGYPEGSSTLVALADGTTSLYLSSGGGVIGGGEHDQVATAAKRLVAAAQHQLEMFGPAENLAVPTDGVATIRVLTFAGPRAISAPEADFGEGRPALSGVFYLAHEVITELRLIEQQR
jgi:hypothetical protein